MALEISESVRNEIIAAVEAADLCCPSQVIDVLIDRAERGEDWRAELARVVANDPAERRRLGIDG